MSIWAHIEQFLVQRVWLCHSHIVCLVFKLFDIFCSKRFEISFSLSVNFTWAFHLKTTTRKTKKKQFQRNKLFRRFRQFNLSFKVYCEKAGFIIEKTAFNEFKRHLSFGSKCLNHIQRYVKISLCLSVMSMILMTSSQITIYFGLSL